MEEVPEELEAKLAEAAQMILESDYLVPMVGAGPSVENG